MQPFPAFPGVPQSLISDKVHFFLKMSQSFVPEFPPVSQLCISRTFGNNWFPSFPRNKFQSFPSFPIYMGIPTLPNFFPSFSCKGMPYVWYPKNRTDLNIIHEENDVIEKEELARVKAQLKRGKHTCLIMRMEHPRAYGVVEQPRAHGAIQVR